MVWACGKNGRVSYIQNGVNGGSKWRASTRESEVVLDGGCKCDLGPQRNDGGGCVKDRKEWRALVHLTE